MILIGLGSNLPTRLHGSSVATLEAAVKALRDTGLPIAAISPWYRSAPVPRSEQPWYVNGVAGVETTLEPAAVLEHLHRIEAEFGRCRSVRNAARVLDLDLLDYHGRIEPGGEGQPILPHPRLHERGFVLLPLRDVAADWRHPVTGADLQAMIAALPADQITQRLDSATR
jgi:2-amino-4-hydroxy-6-hydroxymethyldihydropteridine diphosphokinase